MISLKYIIYCIENITNNKKYIGKCENGLSRVNDHLKHYKNKKLEYRAKLLYRAMRKYGRDNFKFYILKTCISLKYLDKYEIFYINKFKTTDRKYGYNLTNGGTGGNTWKFLSKTQIESAKQKVSAASKLNWTLERREKASVLLKNIRNCPIKSKKNREMAKKRLSKSVIHVESGMRFSSYKDAALEFGVTASAIAYYIKNNGSSKFGTFKTKKVEK